MGQEQILRAESILERYMFECAALRQANGYQSCDCNKADALECMLESAREHLYLDQ